MLADRARQVRNASSSLHPEWCRPTNRADRAEGHRDTAKRHPGRGTLAGNLGVGVMTAYHYFPSKDALMLALIDAVMAEVDPVPPGSDWRSALRHTATATYHTLRRHPWAAGAMLALKAATPGRLQQMDAMLATLDRAGLDSEGADDAFHALEGHIMGFALWEGGMELGQPSDLAARATQFLRHLPRDRYPQVAKHIEQHLDTRRPRSDAAFALTLEAVLDRLESLARGN